MCLLLSLVILLCSSFWASTAFTEGLLDVYQKAQENDPAFKAVSFRKLAVEEGRRQAIAKLLPTISGDADYTYTSQDIKESDNEVFGVGDSDYDTTSYGLILSQPVFHRDLFVGLNQSKAESLWAAAEYAVASQELIVRVADAYLKALVAKDQLVYATGEQTAVEKHLELAKGRHEMGLAPITDLYDATARMATTQAIVIEAQNMLDDAKQGLQEITGAIVVDINGLREVIDLLPPDPANLDTWIQQALEKNPSIELRKQAVEVANYEVKIQGSGHYPALDVVGQYNSEDSDGTLFGGGSQVDTYDVILQLSVPLYQGGFVSSKVREARHLLNSSREELTKEQRAVERQTRSSYLGVKTALSQIDALQQSIVSNTLALEAKQEGFLSGLYTSLNVLDAERDVSLVSIDYARARYRYILNSLKLKAAVGSLAGQDVVDLNPWFQ
jgi:outer membrane protein